jgi:hypothetical protein
MFQIIDEICNLLKKQAVPETSKFARNTGRGFTMDDQGQIKVEAWKLEGREVNRFKFLEKFIALKYCLHLWNIIKIPHARKLALPSEPTGAST